MFASCRKLLCGLRCLALVLPLCALVSSCNLERNAEQPEQNPATATSAEAPTITIQSPGEGDEFVIGDEILVSVLAADSIGVNRVQLFVDNQIVRTVSSESLRGNLSLQAVLNYLPQRRDIGAIVLRALAYRGSVVSEADEITVIVREFPAEILATPAQGGHLPFIPDDGICRALVNVDLNFRHGPSTGFAIITVLSSGTLATITGRNSEHSWWRLDFGGQAGWVSGDYTTEYGDCSAVSVVAG